MQIGRIEIFTDEPVITAENIIPILQSAYPKHLINAARCEYLLDFEAGRQPIDRKKIQRPEIDNRVVDNVAAEIVDFKLGYFFGNPITFVQRGTKDSGGNQESKAIALLNEAYEAEGIKEKNQKLGRFVEICGIGYTYIDIKSEWSEGESPFQIEALDPRYAFVIKSSYYIDHRVMVGVSFRIDDNGNRHYTAITKDARYEIDELAVMTGRRQKVENGSPVYDWNLRSFGTDEQYLAIVNRLGTVPIIEYIRSHDRMGAFEKQIPEMNNLNLLVSDFTNDVEQNTQAVIMAIDIELGKEIVEDENGNKVEVEKTPKNGDWLFTYSTPDGKTPSLQSITSDYQYDAMLNNILVRRNLILKKCHVPERNDDSGGSTGLAMDAATGWNDAEVDAMKEQMIIEPAKMREVRVVLEAIKKSGYLEADNPMLALKFTDVQPSFKRAKSYEMSSKLNAYATGVSHGIAPEHMIKAINFFDDPNQVFEDSKEYLDRYLDSTFRVEEPKEEAPDAEVAPDEERLNQDESDQTENSPLLAEVK